MGASSSEERLNEYSACFPFPPKGIEIVWKRMRERRENIREPVVSSPEFIIHTVCSKWGEMRERGRRSGR